MEQADPDLIHEWRIFLEEADRLPRLGPASRNKKRDRRQYPGAKPD
jgi:hypothetical protein